MQIKFEQKEDCQDVSVEELESLCPKCELNATNSTHGCFATIFTDEDEEFYRKFARAYIYAKQQQPGAYIIRAIEEFGRRNRISGDIHTLAFHYFFWRDEIAPNEAKVMVQAADEMREIAERELLNSEDKNTWARTALSMRKYAQMLQLCARIGKPLIMQQLLL